MNVRPEVDAAEDDAGEAAGKKRRANLRRIALIVVVPLILLIGGLYYYLTGDRYASTENAYVHQSILLVASDVAGRISEVDVKENQMVKPGDVLFRIDPAPFRIALDQADATLADSRQTVSQLKAAYSVAQAKLNAAQHTLTIRARELARAQDLAKKGFTTPANVDTAQLAEQTSQDAVKVANEDLSSAAAALGGNPDQPVDSYPAVRKALAAKAQAQLDLSHSTVTAKADGIVSQVGNLNVGQYADVGTAMLSIVETDKTWVEANFKETQITHMRPGEPATVVVDTYPGVTFHGEVSGIGAATGAEFSVIPAQNATGNWVKVVQRIAVRIKLDDAGQRALRSGMSATATVDTGKTRLQRYMGAGQASGG